MKKKMSRSNRELRALRAQQIIFVVIGLLIIVSMVISLVVH